MRVETNTRLVRRNRRLANYLFFFSMAVLIGGFVIANMQLTTMDNPDTLSVIVAFVLPWIVLPVGFVSTLVSVRMTNLWIRKPRPEDAIREGLKGISKRSILYNYYHFPARHVLITPYGIYVMVTRYQDGLYVVEGDRWKSPGGALRLVSRIFRRDDIGSPTDEALRAAAHIRSALDGIQPGIQVQPLIIFVDPRARLEIINPTVPVLYADSKREPNLRDYMRDHARPQQAPQEVTAAKKKGASKAKAAVADEAPGIIAPEELAEAFEQATIAARR